MPINKTLVLIFVWLSPYLDRFLHECSLILRIDDQHLQRSCINISSAIAQYTKGTKVIIFLLEQVWTQKCAVRKASVDVNISYY